MARLDIDERGLCTLSIEGHDGAHDYLIAPAPAGLDRWACTVQRVAPGPKGEGGPHRVALDPWRGWRCSCGAWKYRKSKEGPRGCLHTRAVGPLYGLMVRLMKEEVNV